MRHKPKGWELSYSTKIFGLAKGLTLGAGGSKSEVEAFKGPLRNQGLIQEPSGIRSKFYSV